MNEWRSLHETIGRRPVLQGIIVVTSLAFLGVRCRPKPQVAPPEQLTKPPDLDIQVNHALMEAVPIPELEHVPDTHTSVLIDPTDPSRAEVYFSAGIRGYRADWQIDPDGSITQLSSPLLISEPQTEARTSYGHLGYSAVSSVVAPTPDHRIGFLHQEYHHGGGYFPFHAQIALTVSKDRGATWTEAQPVITADFPAPDFPGVSGVGQPCAILIDDYIYLYHTNWAPEKHSIHIKRAPIGQADLPHAWESIVAQPQLEPSTTDEKPDVYKALPGVQYLASQSCYLLSFETSQGFAYSTSIDGMSWSKPKLMFSFPNSHDQRQTGDVWYSYPTLVPTSADGLSGILLCSHGLWNQEPHKMVKMPYTISST